jgi:hypothetical protein
MQILMTMLSTIPTDSPIELPLAPLPDRTSLACLLSEEGLSREEVLSTMMTRMLSSLSSKK